MTAFYFASLPTQRFQMQPFVFPLVDAPSSDFYSRFLAPVAANWHFQRVAEPNLALQHLIKPNGFFKNLEKPIGSSWLTQSFLNDEFAFRFVVFFEFLKVVFLVSFFTDCAAVVIRLIRFVSL